MSIAKMFRFHKPRNLITLFHNPSSPSSNRIHSLLTSLNTNPDQQPKDHTGSPSASTGSSASASAYSSPADQTNADAKADFDLETSTGAPTETQLRSIWEFLQQAEQAEGGKGASLGSLVKGAREVGDLPALLRKGPDGVTRPLVVDWGNGRVVVGEDEEGVVGLVRKLKES